MERIGILTAGGDTPALNATIHGAVVRANRPKVEIVGPIKGFDCLFNLRVPHILLNPLYQDIPELDPTKGGTLIGSSRDYVDICEDDAEHMRQTLVATGNLAQPYHSINTDVHKRIRYLETAMAS